MAYIDDVLAATLQRRQEQEEADQSVGPSSPSADAGGDPATDDDLPNLPDIGQPGVGQRRPRSDSTPAGRRAKHARFTEVACNTYQLRGLHRAEVQDFTELDLVRQNIACFALLQSLRSDLASKNLKSYILSPEFKDHTTLMLRVMLLAPTNKGYVTSLTKFLKHDLKNNYLEWKIQKSTIDDPTAFKELVRTLCKKLTADRNSIKETLAEALEQGYCINGLMNRLVPEDIYVTNAHRARFAWILGYYRDHKAKVRSEETTENAFWSDLDNALEEFENRLAARFVDKAELAVVREDTYAEALRSYKQNRPTREAAQDLLHDAPHWQVALEQRLARGHSFA